MNGAPARDDAQRSLEQRALGNVARLAERLGYRDFLDRRKEKAIIILASVGTLALMAAVAVSIAVSSSRDADDLRYRRCLVQFRVDTIEGLRHKLMQERPELTPLQRGQLLEAQVGSAAELHCAPSR